MKIEDDLREALQRAARSATPSSDAWETIDRRRRDPVTVSAQRRLGVVLVAAAIAVGGIAVAIKAFDRHDAQNSPASSLPVGSVQTFDLAWEPSESRYDIAAIAGYAWASGYHSLTLVGPDDAQSSANLKQGPFSLSSSSSATWATGFEPGTGSYVARFPLGSATPDLTVPIAHDLGVHTVVATDLAVWVFAYGGTEDGSLGTLLRLDPATGNTVKTMVLNDVVPATVGHDPIVYATSADEDALWILTAEVAGGELGKITLVRLDASSYQTRVFDPGRVAAFAVGGGAIWLPAAHGAIRLDQESGNETRVEVPGAHPWPFAVSGDSAWFVAGTATEIELVRLDVDGEGIKVGLDVPVPRQSSWGSVDASYDGDGSVWLLYETGRLQKVSVGSVP